MNCKCSYTIYTLYHTWQGKQMKIFKNHIFTVHSPKSKCLASTTDKYRLLYRWIKTANLPAAEDDASSTNRQVWRQVIDRLLFASHPHVRAGGRSPAIYYEAILKVSNYSRNSRWTYRSLSVDQGYRDSMALNYVYNGFCSGFGNAAYPRLLFREEWGHCYKYVLYKIEEDQTKARSNHAYYYPFSFLWMASLFHRLGKPNK